MDIKERSYRGKLFRPTPEVHFEADGSLGLIVTPWGQRQAAKRVIETLKDFILSSRNDNEATSPFQKMTCLTPLANSLRVAIMLANDSMYREENRNEYTGGVELLVFARDNNEIAWAQIGHPALFLNRAGYPLMPLGFTLDLSAEMTAESKYPAPLPQTLLGVNSTSNFAVHSFRPQPNDQLIFLSRSTIPGTLLSLSPDNRNLDGINELLAKEQPDLPFWVGISDVGDRAA